MSKLGGKDLDNVTRLITKLPGEEAAKVLKEIKNEKDPEGKRRIISRELEKKGLKPL
jgi:NurA-like 5'-3' nuclease